MEKEQIEVLDELIIKKQKLKQWVKKYPSFLDNAKGKFKRRSPDRFIHTMLCKNNPTIFTGGKTEYDSLRDSAAGKGLIEHFIVMSRQVVSQRDKIKKAEYNKEKKIARQRKAAADEAAAEKAAAEKAAAERAAAERAARQKNLLKEQVKIYFEEDNSCPSKWLRKVAGMPEPKKKGGQKRATSSRDVNTGAGPSSIKKIKPR